MSAQAEGHASAGIGALLPVFARTRGSWWTAVAAAVAAVVVVVLHAVTQGLTLSPAQQADGLYGRFDHMRAGVASYPLGDGPDVAALSSALGEAGATDMAVALYAQELGAAQEISLGAVRYEEQELTGTPAGVVMVLDGAAPQNPGEACASPALAERLRGLTRLSFFDGALPLRITCTARDDQARDGVTLYAAPGTWSGAGRGLSPEELRRWGVTASANVFWSGGNGAEGASALAAALGTDPRPSDYEAGRDLPPTAQAMRETPRSFNAVSNVWVFLVPLFLVPALTAAVTSWGGGRMLVRAVDTLAALGIRRNRTRGLTVMLPLVLTFTGSLIGIASGVLLGTGARVAVAGTLPRPLGPWSGLPTVGLIVVVMSLIGVVLGSSLALARLTPRLRADLIWARRARVPWPSTSLLTGLVALCLIAAVCTIVDATTNSRRVAGVALVGMAVVLLVPLAMGLRSKAGLDRRPSGLLQSRLITAAGGSWLVMLLFGLQAVLTTGAVTMATSAVETFNSSLVSAVPEDQARVDVLNVGDPVVASGVVEDVRAALGAAEDFPYRMLEAPTSAADGPVVVVDTLRQAADVLGLPGLTPDAAQALNDGGVLRSATAAGGSLTVLDPASAPTGERRVVADLSITALPGVAGSLATGGGVVLTSAAQGMGLPISPEIAHVFPRLTPEQRATAAELPERLHFNPQWMDLPKAPDTMSLPDSAAWGSAVLAGMGTILALIYGLQAGAAGRRVLAGAQAMGLRRSWVRSVLAGQIAWVVLAPAVAGVVGSALGVVALATLKGIPLDLHVPWTLVGVMAAGTALAFGGAVVLALRGLDVRERLG